MGSRRGVDGVSHDVVVAAWGSMLTCLLSTQRLSGTVGLSLSQ